MDEYSGFMGFLRYLWDERHVFYIWAMLNAVFAVVCLLLWWIGL